MKAKLRDFLMDLALGAVIAALVFALNMSRDYGAARSICDGFFVAAVMLIGIGGIRGVRNKGAFDVAGFGLKSALVTVFPALQKEKEDLPQYIERKSKERRSASGLLAAGAVYLALSVIALIVYQTR